MTAVTVPSTVDVLDLREAATEYIDTVSGYQGESPWEYARGVAAALAWLAGEGPRPLVACEWCTGRGEVVVDDNEYGVVQDAMCGGCDGTGVVQ